MAWLTQILAFGTTANEMEYLIPPRWSKDWWTPTQKSNFSRTNPLITQTISIHLHPPIQETRRKIAFHSAAINCSSRTWCIFSLALSCTSSLVLFHFNANEFNSKWLVGSCGASPASHGKPCPRRFITIKAFHQGKFNPTIQVSLCLAAFATMACCVSARVQFFIQPTPSLPVSVAAGKPQTLVGSPLFRWAFVQSCLNVLI